MSPAVEGVQKAHRLFLVVGGAGFEYRTYQYLYKPAADGVNEYGDQNSGEWVGERSRQDCRRTSPAAEHTCAIIAEAR